MIKRWLIIYFKKKSTLTATMSLYSKPLCLWATIDMKKSIDDSKAKPYRSGDFTSKRTWFKICEDWISDGPCVLHIRVESFNAT